MPSVSNILEVLALFLIPIGGGIPAGVVLAHKYLMSWPLMALIYFVSDVILALCFEPLMLLFLKLTKNSAHWNHFIEAMRTTMTKLTDKYSANPNPFVLIMVSFGVDPMVGRSAAKAAGHNFISGWAIAIAGDMIYFLIIMASVLWLSDLLGDGTWAVLLITLLILLVPVIARRIRKLWGPRATLPPL